MAYSRLQEENYSGAGQLDLAGSDADSKQDTQVSSLEDDADSDRDFDGQGYELKDLGKGRGSTSSYQNEPRSDDGEGYELRPIRRGSASTAHSFMLYTPDEERGVKRKFDRRLVLFVAFLYMLSFLDRSSNPSPLSSVIIRLIFENRHWKCQSGGNVGRSTFELFTI